MSCMPAINLNDLQPDPAYLTGQTQRRERIHIGNIDIDPCTGCQHNRECMTGQQACQQFCNYVQGRDWTGIERQPSSFFYKRLNLSN
ncbi:hypothetical protein EZMO1_1820 [Endozoicomonas montiporae CL-33]|nr:hypothetical protein [Endozoicomonas montiporae]AMO55963.1 hypothetical protein EZMO1_1820 [Endozoicomonas montiporae CL-33]